MVDQVVCFYQKLYQETQECRPMVEGLEFEHVVLLFFVLLGCFFIFRMN